MRKSEREAGWGRESRGGRGDLEKKSLEAKGRITGAQPVGRDFSRLEANLKNGKFAAVSPDTEFILKI